MAVLGDIPDADTFSLIKPIAEHTQSASTLYIPDGATEGVWGGGTLLAWLVMMWGKVQPPHQFSGLCV